MMGMTSPFSCLSDAFSPYCVSFSLIYLNRCHLTKIYFLDESDNDGSGSAPPGKSVYIAGDPLVVSVV